MTEQSPMPVSDVVKPDVTFRSDSACGYYRSRVIQPHRDAGYWITQIIEGGHPALLGSIQIVNTVAIYRARTGRNPH
jgi:hypothetical protein